MSKGKFQWWKSFWLAGLLALTSLFSGCLGVLPGSSAAETQEALASGSRSRQGGLVTPAVAPPLYETPRPLYQPGELVEYIAQTGDTLDALARRFNTTVEEIRAANPIIPADATTMPPGMPMQIPIYYLPFWGTQFKIIPDSQFINGPAVVGFDPGIFVSGKPGWLANYSTYAAGQRRSGADIVQLVATNYSISPRVLLALLEYQAGALTQPDPPANVDRQLLGIQEQGRDSLYMQLVVAANRLNNAYYGWRNGSLVEFDLQNNRLERPDPWQNAATVAFQAYFARLLEPEAYAEAISPRGIAAVYQQLFGDPWKNDVAHLPGSLVQPPLALPFEAGKSWAYTGGPHTGWGSGAPFAAIDFAPPADAAGCRISEEWATAVAEGVIVRVDDGVAVLDLDGDGDERTGWVVFYLHLAATGRARLGAVLKMGDPIGHPSCEGGTSTGSHIHIARKYNGEWIAADGAIPFSLEGWVARNGSEAYQGTLVRFSQVVTACVCANQASFVTRERPAPTPLP